MKNTNKIIIYQTICLLLMMTIGILLVNKQKEEIAMEEKNISIKKDALSVIMNRKSVRDFNSEKTINKEDIDIIIKAGMAAPSGRDARPWEIVVVDDRKTLDAMAEKLPYAKMLTQSPVAMVICGDTTKSSYWHVDCSAVTENILLAVEALNLGAVWTATYPYEDRMNVVIENLKLPHNILPLAVIPMGYPQGKHKAKDKFDANKVHYNQW